MIFLCSLVVFDLFLLNCEQIWFAEEIKEGFPVFANSFYVMRNSRLLLYRPCTVRAESWPNVLNMPLELLFETLLCNEEFRNLQFSGVTFGKYCWGCAARTDQKKCLFQLAVFRPDL